MEKERGIRPIPSELSDKASLSLIDFAVQHRDSTVLLEASINAAKTVAKDPVRAAALEAIKSELSAK